MLERRMWRFYAIAALIVLTIGAIAFGRRIATTDFDVRGGKPDPNRTPTNTRGGNVRATAAPKFGGDGPWVMSALPECFEQQSSTIGPVGLLKKDVPPEGERLRPATTLRRGDCTIVVGEHDVWIYRNGDRLRVPPEARLYAHGERLTLVWLGPYGRTEIRRY
jgi:hypothetical protein